jgi:hypothetical protein
MELLAEQLFARVYGLVGLSHLLQPHPWMAFFEWLRSRPFGGFIVVMYTLPIGIAILLVHPNWSIKPSVIVTLAGWLMVAKSVLYALHPSSFEIAAKKGFTVRNSRRAGLGMVILCATIFVDGWTH